MDCVWPIVFFALSTWVTNSIANINFERGEQLSSLNFVQINGQYLNVATAVTMEVKNMFSCAGECRKNTTCSTFNLAKYGETFTCEILPEDLCGNRDKLVADSSRQVFYFKSPCCDNPCENEGTCSMSYTKTKYLCSCKDYHGGDNCETKDLKEQYCYLYSDFDKTGEKKFVDGVDRLAGFEDRTKSASCFGIWILYSGDFDNHQKNVLLSGESETLFNLDASMSSGVSAIRPVGPKSDPFRKDWIVFYTKNEYFGDELLVEDSLATMPAGYNDAISSLIIKGTSSWTFYDGASFNSGLPESAWKVCLAGRSDGKMKMFWTMESFSGSLVISSVKKGCHSSVIVR